MHLPTAGLVVIKDRKLLLAYSCNKKAFYLPGGKISSGETSIQALLREVNEELGIELNQSSLQYYCHISAFAYGERNDLIMEQDCYITQLTVEPVPGAEIGELAYHNLDSFSQLPVQVPGVKMIFEHLRKDGLVD